MKKLELNQMENLNGGTLSNRDCMLRGFGMVVSAAVGFWPVTLMIGVTSGDCY